MGLAPAILTRSQEPVPKFHLQRVLARFLCLALDKASGFGAGLLDDLRLGGIVYDYLPGCKYCPFDLSCVRENSSEIGTERY